MMTVLDTPVAVRRTAMGLLARRGHGCAKLSRKLHQRGTSTKLIDPILDRPTEEGLLDEPRYLESFIADRARSDHEPLHIREELTQHGLPRADTERALGACEVDWSVQLREVWCRKFARLLQDAREKAQQGRFPAYRGYSVKSISRLLNGRSGDRARAGAAALAPVFR